MTEKPARRLPGDRSPPASDLHIH